MELPHELRRARRSARRILKAVSGFLNTGRSAAGPLPGKSPFSPGITEILNFASNPGNLRMLVYVPPTPLRPRSPLVVVLHGCAQNAADLARDAGWIAMADRHGFPLLMPEQQEENNQGRCFNWFHSTETRRGSRESHSITQMVAAAVQRFHSDPARVFVVGLSAGGAMTAAVMAAYPEVFASGAVIAGLPVGCASNAAQAFRRMIEPGPRLSAEAWEAKVRAAAPPGFRGRWPRISIWHGCSDSVVNPTNSVLLARQWTAVHGIEYADVTETHRSPGIRRKVWGEPREPVVELWCLEDFGHAYPISGIGQPSQWVARASASATDRFARFCGLC